MKRSRGRWAKWVRVLGLVPSLLLGGCTYFSQRALDLGDCFRLEAGVGTTLGAWVNVGPLLHEGFGTSENIFAGQFGWRYGYPPGRRSGDSVFPMEGWGLWGHRCEGEANGSAEFKHKCYALLPILTSSGGGSIRWLHAFDLEFGAGFGVGASAGFSPGEFLDFLLGWFGVDIAHDDLEDRKARDYFRDRARRPEEEGSDPKPVENQKCSPCSPGP